MYDVRDITHPCRYIFSHSFPFPSPLCPCLNGVFLDLPPVARSVRPLYSSSGAGQVNGRHSTLRPKKFTKITFKPIHSITNKTLSQLQPKKFTKITFKPIHSIIKQIKRRHNSVQRIKFWERKGLFPYQAVQAVHGWWARWKWRSLQRESWQRTHRYLHLPTSGFWCADGPLCSPVKFVNIEILITRLNDFLHH